MLPDLALAAVIIAAALFIIVLAGWAGMLDRPIGVARRIARRIVNMAIIAFVVGVLLLAWMLFDNRERTKRNEHHTIR